MNGLALCAGVGGIVISCGWNSNGFGKKRGFELIEILLVAHGGHHNDTIVCVEKKINQVLENPSQNNLSTESEVR